MKQPDTTCLMCALEKGMEAIQKSLERFQKSMSKLGWQAAQLDAEVEHRRAMDSKAAGKASGKTRMSWPGQDRWQPGRRRDRNPNGGRK